ncbi:DUF4272 domain-containing protein [Vitreoscilla massiliensis]|uniref:DUF4272 domain-containing protein n=1 Tax=Vitreoscilla massiliensis TaxID=1689272 RepID=A0ABY4E320_9NEIS|nr:DUF4272 domain-containing protein [Vitreoscilla massiliensis]UOO90175.1 DUF4272 domain-containing protein [Vitreoscilla massiliensis]
MTGAKGVEMAILVNAYATVVALPPLDFRGEVLNQRDDTDAELAGHLQGFIGYVLQLDGEDMTQSKYYTMKHIERVKHQVSAEVDEHDLDDFALWAERANAIVYLPDGSVRAPNGAQILPATDEPVLPPTLPSAWARKQRTEAALTALGIRTPVSLPAVIADEELRLRPAAECLQRALGCCVAAVMADTRASGEPFSTDELQEKFPQAYGWMTPQERDFVESDYVDEQDCVNFTWRYEAIATLMWALEALPALPKVDEVCDVSALAGLVLNMDVPQALQAAHYRADSEILDALDEMYRLQWLVHDCHHQGKNLPEHIHGGVVQERLYALNWLTGFDVAEWDDIQTPA